MKNITTSAIAFSTKRNKLKDNRLQETKPAEANSAWKAAASASEIAEVAAFIAAHPEYADYM